MYRQLRVLGGVVGRGGVMIERCQVCESVKVWGMTEMTEGRKLVVRP